jgi:hypothetical protein
VLMRVEAWLKMLQSQRLKPANNEIS